MSQNNFFRINADLHLHGLYSGAVSASMIPKTIAEQAPLKGLQLLGTADILHAKWIELVKEHLKPTEDEAILEHQNGTKFILQTEVEDNNRVHHIILFPSFSKVEEVREKLKSKCKNLDFNFSLTSSTLEKEGNKIIWCTRLLSSTSVCRINLVPF